MLAIYSYMDMLALRAHIEMLAVTAYGGIFIVEFCRSLSDMYAASHLGSYIYIFLEV